MHTIHQYKQTFRRSTFLILCIITSAKSMEPEIKQRLLSNNADIHIAVDQDIVDDCGICYETTKVIFIPCKNGTKHPMKICKDCLVICGKICPYCRDPLIDNSKFKTYILDNVCFAVSCVSFVTYISFILHSFS
jgi:hypothetical protein